MSFEVFVGQTKVTPNIEAALRGQVTDQQPPFDLSKGSPTQRLVGQWVEDLIRITKERLQRSGINASNQLSQSIQVVPIDLNEDTLTIGIEMNGYWKFVDLGVKGAKSSAKAPNSPFQYREKGPPVRDLQQYIAFKAIPVVPTRDIKTGNMRTKEQQAELMARGMSRAIRLFGTKETRFLTDSLTEDKINVLVEDIAEAIGKQIGVSVQL